MRNILIFSIDYFPYVGGAEVAVRETCKRIPDCAFTLITCWNDRSLPRREIIDGVTIIRVGVGIRKIDKYILPFTGLAMAFRLQRTTPFSAAWAIMANTGALAAFTFTRFYTGIRYVLTLQEGDSEGYYARRTWFWYPLYRALHARADHIHVISKYLAIRAKKFGYRGVISVIPNGVDQALFNATPLSSTELARVRNILGVIEGERVVITTSRLEYKNGVDIFIRAFALVKDMVDFPLKAIIAGSGSEERRLKSLALNLRVADTVIFTGSAGREDVAAFLKLASVFARPSRSEGLGNSFLEAMACGIPVVGTPVGGIPDFLVNEKTGLFCDPENPRSLADAILRILTDAELRGVLVRDGIASILKQYTWDSIAPRISREVFFVK